MDNIPNFQPLLLEDTLLMCAYSQLDAIKSLLIWLVAKSLATQGKWFSKTKLAKLFTYLRQKLGTTFSKRGGNDENITVVLLDISHVDASQLPSTESMY